MPSISVVVPIFNAADLLPAFFESLNQALPSGAQVILIDDCSSDDVWKAVPAIPNAASVEHLRNARNLGHSATVNRGLALATGDFIVQLNTDLVLEPKCLTAMIDLIEHEPHAGIVGAKLVYPTTGLTENIGIAVGDYSKVRVFHEIPADHVLANRTRQVQAAPGAALTMTKAVLQAIGPLDERYFNRNEDIEHCLRAAALGFRNFCCADALAHHWKSQSGPARFVRARTADALFWSRWGSKLESDLGRYVDEAIAQLLEEFPDFADTPFQVVDLSRGADQPIVLDCLSDRWADIAERVYPMRQTNNAAARLHLSRLLPGWMAHDPLPFIYLVDQYRELEDNAKWFANRRTVVTHEVIVDLKGCVLPTSALARSATTGAQPNQ